MFKIFIKSEKLNCEPKMKHEKSIRAGIIWLTPYESYSMTHVAWVRVLFELHDKPKKVPIPEMARFRRTRKSGRCSYVFIWSIDSIWGSFCSVGKHHKMCQDFSPQCKFQSGPMVVHCSAGIGRSGAFIVCDMICDLIKKNGHQSIINIKDAVKHCRLVTILPLESLTGKRRGMTHTVWVMDGFREHRPGMVQTEDQYKFIYRAIEHHVNKITNYEIIKWGAVRQIIRVKSETMIARLVVYLLF